MTGEETNAAGVSRTEFAARMKASIPEDWGPEKREAFELWLNDWPLLSRDEWREKVLRLLHEPDHPARPIAINFYAKTENLFSKNAERFEEPNMWEEVAYQMQRHPTTF
jgi:hypothetical protein